LLKDGDGGCEAWTKAFLDALKTQGIKAKDWYVDVSAQVKKDKAGLLILHWDFKGDGTSGDPDFKYINLAENLFPGFVGKGAYNWIGAPEVTDVKGVAGQGNDNPASLFTTHVVAFINGTYYDPSYGRTYTSLNDMQQKIIAGFFVQDRLKGGQIAIKIMRHIARNPITYLQEKLSNY
jgi:hypothetical protein